MHYLQKEFKNRNELVAYVKALAPWASGGHSAIMGGQHAANQQLAAIDLDNYARTRNHGDGCVTKLSPYIRHGMLSLNQVRNYALAAGDNATLNLKFIQELAWRDFWQRVALVHPDWLWHDIEPYKTGFNSCDYANTLPEDIKAGNTGVACLDFFIQQLIATGYIHNHARLYLASYIIHFRRIKWQCGASWFLHHLLDGDLASNNFSWQWVASTFSIKPYLFNLENVQRYFSSQVDTSVQNNKVLDQTYDMLRQHLFPKLKIA